MDLYRELYILSNLTVFQFKLIFPYWIAGVAAGSLLSVFASDKIKNAVSRLQGEKYNPGAAVAASVLGIASPICMYGTIPLIAALGRKGVPQYILATFMVSSILLNPNLLLFSFALGTPLALVRAFVCILAGVLAGLLVKVFFKRKEIFSFSGFEERKKTGHGDRALIRLLKDLNKAVTITAPYFLLGILLTALFEQYFPKTFILNLFGNNNGLGVLLAASMGVPVYVCGGGTIPLVRSWLDAGMSPGSAVAFMVSGPATKLTNLSAVKIILGARNFILYIVFSILVAVVSGFGTDFIFGIIHYIK